MKNSSILIILFLIALIGVTANFYILIDYTSENVDNLINNNQKILSLTKTNEVVYSLNKYYYQLKGFTDKISFNYTQKDKIKSLFQEHVDKFKYIKALFLISDNKIDYSYPSKIPHNNILDVKDFIYNDKDEATLIVSSKSVKLIDSLPERILFSDYFNSNSKKEHKNVFVVTEIDLNSLLRLKEKESSVSDCSVWMLGSLDIVLGSSKNFNDRGLATIAYNKLIADKRISHISVPFTMFGNDYKIVLTHNKRLLYESIYPLPYDLIFVATHLLMIIFILAILFGIVCYEFIFTGLNDRIVKLNIKVDELEKQKTIGKLVSSDYFQDIVERAKKMKEKSD